MQIQHGIHILKTEQRINTYFISFVARLLVKPGDYTENDCVDIQCNHDQIHRMELLHDGPKAKTTVRFKLNPIGQAIVMEFILKLPPFEIYIREVVLKI